MKTVCKIQIIGSAVFLMLCNPGLFRVNTVDAAEYETMSVTGRLHIVNGQGPLRLSTNVVSGTTVSVATLGTNGNMTVLSSNGNVALEFDYDYDGGIGALHLKNGAKIYQNHSWTKIQGINNGLKLDGSDSQWIKFFAITNSTPDILIDTNGTTIAYDLTVSGTNNVLANQLLLSDDSILTRNLGDSRYNMSFTKIVRVDASDDLYNKLNANLAASTWFQIAPGTYNLTNTFGVNANYVRISGSGYEQTSITNNPIKIDTPGLNYDGTYFDNFHAIGNNWFEFGSDSSGTETTMESVKVTGNDAFVVNGSENMQFNLFDCIVSGTGPLVLISASKALLVNTDVNGIVYNGEYTNFQNGTASGTLTNDFQASALFIDESWVEPQSNLSMGSYTNRVSAP